MSVLISSQSDICDGMTDIRVAIHCNQPLAFPATLKRLRLRGKYDYPLVLPEGLEEIYLGTYGMRVQLPKSIRVVQTGPGGYKILLLPPTDHYVIWVDKFGNKNIQPHAQPLQIIHNHGVSSIYCEFSVSSCLFTMHYNETGHRMIAKSCQIARLLYGILKMRKGYGRDVAYPIMRAIISTVDQETVGGCVKRPRL